MRALVLWADEQSPNLGVRALGAGTSHLLRRVWPDVEVTYHNYGARSTPVPVGMLRYAARERVTGRGGLVPWLASFDLVIDTRSGDSFADIYGLRRLAVMTALADAVRRAGVPLVMGPQTIGPFGSRLGRYLGRRSMSMAGMVMARDSVSAGVARSLGRADVVPTTDVVFALPEPPGRPRRDVVLNVSGLLWQPGPHVPHELYRGVVVGAVRSLVADGRRVTLVPHVLDSPSADNDVRVLPDVVRAVGGVVDVAIPTSLDDVRGIVGAADLVIGSRMHVCLNALSVGTPAIALAYSRKFQPLLADLGWPHTIDLSSDPDPAGALRQTLGEVEGSDPPAVRERATSNLDSAVRALGAVL